VCPNNPEHFVARVREIGGFELEKLPRLEATASPAVPERIPLVYHASGRDEPLQVPAVAVKLGWLLRRTDHRCKWNCRHDVLSALKVDASAQLVIDGIGLDRGVERFWGPARAAGVVEELAALGPSWVLTPNYSLFSNVPRWDNLHAMKRIAVVWHELTAAGVPTALHVNARMVRDWRRWAEFIAPRPEVQAVCFEFATGGRLAETRETFAQELARLGNACDGRLRLFLRGGVRLAPRLAKSFSTVSIVDTNAFMTAVKRRRVVSPTGAPSKTWTLRGQPLDDLLHENIRAGIGSTPTHDRR
jgi:hypothetical protein